jgi:hypothetical protein
MADIGLATTGTLTFATPATPTTFSFAATSYVVATPLQESGFSNELTLVIPSGSPPPPPPLPGPDPACAFPTGAKAIQVFASAVVGTTGSVGSRAYVQYQIGSPGSPVVQTSVLLNGAPASTILGADLTTLGSQWFRTPLLPGTYDVAVLAQNAYGCQWTTTLNAAGQPLRVTVK